MSREEIVRIGVRKSAADKLREFLQRVKTPPSAVDFASQAIDDAIKERVREWGDEETK